MIARALLPLLAGCDITLSEIDNIYSRGADGLVVCGISVDFKNEVSNDAIASGLDRAQVDGTVLHLYTHRPGGTVDVSTIEHILAGAADRDLPFLTYRDLAEGRGGTTGLAFSFDDRDIRGWHGLLPLFADYGARVTFFISQFHALEDDERMLLRELAREHDVEYHSTNHRDAEVVVAEQGLDAYVAEEIVPDLMLMRAAGYDPVVFAYPFGSRSAATDEANAAYFSLLRGSSHDCPR